MGVENIPTVENKTNVFFDETSKEPEDSKEHLTEGDKLESKPEEDKPTISLEQLQSEIERLKSTNSRLLSESQKYKKDKERAIEEKLKLENNKDELLNLRERQLAEYREREMSTNIAAAVAAEAERRGCENWDFLLQTGDTSPIDYDEETGSVSGIKDFFDLHENNQKYSIFFKKNPAIIPNTSTPSNPSDYDINSDPLAYIKKVRTEANKTGDYSRYNQLVSKFQRQGIIR